MSDTLSHVRIPIEALHLCRDMVEMGAICKMYDAADQVRWKPFRYSSKEFRGGDLLSGRAYTRLVAGMTEAGLLQVVEPGRGRVPALFQLRDPTTGVFRSEDAEAERKRNTSGTQAERANLDGDSNAGGRRTQAEHERNASGTPVAGADPIPHSTNLPSTPPPAPPRGGEVAGEGEELDLGPGDEPREAGCETEARAEASPQDASETHSPPATSPSWLPRPNRMPRGLDGDVLVGAVLDCIEIVTEGRPDPAETRGAERPVLTLWRRAYQSTTNLGGMVREVGMVVAWARYAAATGARLMQDSGRIYAVDYVLASHKWAGRLQSARAWVKKGGWTWDGRRWQPPKADGPPPPSSPPPRRKSLAGRGQPSGRFAPTDGAYQAKLADRATRRLASSSGESADLLWGEVWELMLAGADGLTGDLDLDTGKVVAAYRARERAA